MKTLGCVLAFTLLLSGTGGGGEIRGRVEVVTRLPAPETDPGHAYGHGGAMEGMTEPKPEFAEAEKVILYVDVADFRPGPPPGLHPRLLQRAKTFIPPVLPVRVGTMVDFPNEDGIYHNVFSYSRAKRFDLGRYPKGSSRSVNFDKPGLVKVYCEIHKDMIAYILVLETPFFAVPDAKGEYRITGLPPGNRTLRVWHPAIPPQTRSLNVPESGAAEADFKL